VSVCLAESLFSRLIAHTYRWSQSLGGDEPHVFHRKARFFLDNEHDFVLEMAPPHLARIKASTSYSSSKNDLVVVAGNYTSVVCSDSFASYVI